MVCGPCQRPNPGIRDAGAAHLVSQQAAASLAPGLDGGLYMENSFVMYHS